MKTTSRRFDTRIDTMNFFVPMTIKFKKRNYINQQGLSPIMLHVSSKKRRERIPIDLYVNPKFWDSKNERLKGPDTDVYLDNLILDNIRSKITKIKTFFKLSDIPLTMDSFLFEFKNNLSRTNFVAFYLTMLNDRRDSISKSTYSKEFAVYTKLKNWQEEILFNTIDEMLITKYRNHLAKLGNKRTTRNGNIKIIKKYLGFAEKAGIKLKFHLEDIACGSTQGNKCYLNAKEIKKLYEYYNSAFIPENHKLALGYFLFSCFTGLRYSDLMQQKRIELLKGEFYFIHVKTKKPQFMKLNKKAMDVLKHDKNLFVKKYSNNNCRVLVKKICKFLHIHKPVDFHTSRHSFGTNNILMGESVKKLQILMNHSSIKETNTYLHLAELERNARADLLDNLF